MLQRVFDRQWRTILPTACFNPAPQQRALHSSAAVAFKQKFDTFHGGPCLGGCMGALSGRLYGAQWFLTTALAPPQACTLTQLQYLPSHTAEPLLIEPDFWGWATNGNGCKVISLIRWHIKSLQPVINMHLKAALNWQLQSPYHHTQYYQHVSSLQYKFLPWFWSNRQAGTCALCFRVLSAGRGTVT